MVDSALKCQGNSDPREAVCQQRTLKRKKDKLRKLEKLISLKRGNVEYNELLRERQDLMAEVAAMETALGVAVPEAKGAPTAPQTAPTITSDTCVEESPVESTLYPVSAAHSTTATLRAPCGVQRGDRAQTQESSQLKGVAVKTVTEQQTAMPTPAAAATETLQHKPETPSSASGRIPVAVENVEPVQTIIEDAHSETRPPLFPDILCQPPFNCELVHYQVAELTLLMESMVIVGGSARTLAMIQAFKSLLSTTPVLSVPSLRDVTSKDFEALINENFNFLRRGREPSAGMTYVKEVLVRRVAALLSSGGNFRVWDDGSFSPFDCKRHGSQDCSEFPLPLNTEMKNSLLAGDPREMAIKVLAGIETELRLSIKSIVEDRSKPLISSNDTILVFGRSSIVELILLGAANNPRLGVKPEVIVVDAAPLYEGRMLAKRLTASGLRVTYGLITSCCTLIPRCTRVFIGAAAVLQNGDVFSRCGTALVVASAKQYRKPVLCFSESFKFVSEVWLGNLGQNTQLNFSQKLSGDHRMRSPGGMSSPRYQGRDINQQPSSRGGDILPLPSTASSASGYLYDLTPAAFIDMIICEMGCLDTSAIVAALRDREDRDASLMSVA
ncbi:putative translation initiation factor eIF2B delta subunit [Trypanosoma rangeli]|uniref:Translation initiation factor eIF2B subunit delta n=1 Tax=Trypanosoma rangeli TaxID=5698 RepID=A0A422MX80_TRYRA|nr:putative translation initiation factor eIF2B delta subunit [Trypanosoma rangeli]RNE97816.1 putative translation initiation factor eIF2B delta subunit [Trypanosoma rangeli]|eukprot:RNE97816.1 putative translation initiation factor eIF2B delta subunit [Trypanosoma rangeli]